MKKQTLLKIVIIVMGIDLLFLVVSAFFHTVMPYEIYRIIHPIFGFVLLICALLHIYLNLNWIKSTFFKK